MSGLTRALRRLAAVGATATAIAGMQIDCGMAASADVQPASPSAVAAALGAGKIPAALVILVDISDSMAATPDQHGLYPQVLTQVPRFLAALAKQNPNDRVAVVVFGNRRDTRTVYPMGPPKSGIPLPPNADSLGTDIGYAFERALDNLGRAPKNIQVGGVLLLSDGGNWEPGDSQYDGGRGYNAPGWAVLRQRVQGLGIPVTGYGLPLASDPGVNSDLDAALTACFGSQRVMLSSDFSDLSTQLDLAQQKILNSRVAAAAAPDSGQGVKVTWSGPGVSGGTVHLDLLTGKAEPSVTLTATTSRVPLDVSGLSAQVTGAAVKISGQVSQADVALRPGHSVTLPVKLTWNPVTSGNPSWSGRIILRGHVYSPFGNAIRNYYQDRAFTAGKLTGTASAAYLAAIPPPGDPFVIVLPALLALLALGGLAFYRSRLSGSLRLADVDSSLPEVSLPSRPWYSLRTDGLPGAEGLLKVRGSPISRDMYIRHSRSPKISVKLPRGGQAMVAGIDVTHNDGTR